MRRLIGIHAVTAALRKTAKGSAAIERIVIARGSRNPRLQEIVQECRRLGIPVRFEPTRAVGRLARTAAHQGVVAQTSARSYAALEDVLADAPEQCMLAVLDEVQDPRNLGAIIRSAEAAGAVGVVVPERRSASLGPAAAKAAAGALESLPVIRVKNLGRGLDELKRHGFWAYGLDAKGKADFDRVDYQDRCALVLGGERRGLRAKVAERCDFLVRIPMEGSVPSLNVSVAAGIALFEVGRQRRQGERAIGKL
ncbi:MAG: 23S rRNA (guanosine(2251)-2'-O)-methyltransferase RlmB [Bryobacterales bacterium]|nr:23S rRNA (guanosine(2251)-2'-O)-methyltransferase RlmB [Bryobacterales bacterium]